MENVWCPYCRGKIFSAHWEEGRKTYLHCGKVFEVEAIYTL